MSRYQPKEASMVKIGMLLVAIALLASPGTIDSVSAQEPAAQQDQSGDVGRGYMMSPWMMSTQGMPYGNMGPGWMMGWSGRGASMCSAMGSHIEGRLAYLKAELKISYTQKTLWETYAGTVRENAQSMSAHCTDMMGQGRTAALSLPDRLDRHEQFMAVQLDALRAMNKALKPLYAALSETQKQAADQLFWGPMGMM
jgi:opacity protein-like surface antigen